MADDQPEQPGGEHTTPTGGDHCRPVIVTGIDGEEIVIPVLGAEPMNETTRGYFEQLVQAVQRRYRSEHPGAEA